MLTKSFRIINFSAQMESPLIVVARFLEANNYNETLSVFLWEAGLPSNAGTILQGDVTLEKILEEKRVFDLSLRTEKIDSANQDKPWSMPAPSLPTRVSLPSSTNLLHVSIQRLKYGAAYNNLQQVMLAATADRQYHLITLDQDFSLWKSLAYLHDSPILSCAAVGAKYPITITAGMSGQVILYDHGDEKVLEERSDHKKYVVEIAAFRTGLTTWIATAGWDFKVFIYRMVEPDMVLGGPVGMIATTTVSESINFIEHPDLDHPILIVSRRDSTTLCYYRLSAFNRSTAEPPTPPHLSLLGSQNLAPHSNAWIAFSPSSIALCPQDPTLLAVATSATPHMKCYCDILSKFRKLLNRTPTNVDDMTELMIVRLLIPVLASSRATVAGPATQAIQAQADLAIQDREEAAIQLHVNTLAPQTPYSTPKVVWRPDGSGVWVNGDDGVLRGLEVKTGKVVATLKDGHELGSKIRTIWCGQVNVEGKEEEWLISGGFDRRLVVWKP
ncbi:hypothetical protein ACLMJK_006678 [Lecanora helva]